MDAEPRLDDLREDVLGLTRGEHALADALTSVQNERGVAAAAHRAVVRSLAEALEARDGYTGAHSNVVHVLSLAVAEQLELDEGALSTVDAVALLHDIGKIGIPDEVLHKPGPLDDAEWSLMHLHPVIGERILLPLPGFGDVARAVRHGHEHWDGAGYPDGLAGEDIPLASRIVLACDAWSALVSDRPYRAALGLAEARAELERCAGSQFDPQVVEALLACLARGVGTTADNRLDGAELQSTLDGSARRFEREMHALLALASAVATVETFDEVIEIAAEEACRAVDADSFSISRWEADTRVLRTLVNAGDLADWEERRPTDETYVLDDDDALRLLLLDGRSYLTSLDDPDVTEADEAILRASGKHACVAVPIVLGGVPWGEVWAARGSHKPVFGEHDARFLGTVAGQIAAAAGRTELYARMAELAYRDALTGVGNRRGLEEHLDLALHEAEREGRDLAVVLCDLDNLKELNDTHGHHAGDDALRLVADALVAEADGGGEVYRVGGDEFCLVLLDGGADRGVAVGRRVLDRLAGAPGYRISISCGVASVAMGARRPADLLRAADAAQYAAKRTGRGRVCLAHPDSGLDWRRAPVAGPRRKRRRGSALVVDKLLAEVLVILDGSLALAEPLTRLEGVMSPACALVDAARGAVSYCALGSDLLETQSSLDLRTGHIWRRGLGAAGETISVAAYPATAALLETGGALLVDAGDPGADSAEVARLREYSMQAVLAVAVADSGGSWLVELYSDETAVRLSELAPALRLLAGEAVRVVPSRASRRSAAA